MINKLTYEISKILIANDYIEIIVKDKKSNKKVDIQFACIKFRYIPKEDKSYLNFTDAKESAGFELAESDINEVIIDNDSLTIETDDKTYYCYEGYDPVYGARPLKRYISNTLETIIAKKIIAGDIYSGCTVVIDGDNENINVSVK